MDIDRLKYFYAIYKSGSLTEASVSVGISQPALSKAMKLLEAELGFELLLSSGRGIQVTDQGQKVAQKIPQILSDLEGLKGGFDSHQEVLRLTSFEVFTTYFLGELIQSQAFESESIDVHELHPGEMEEQIALGNVDIGISYISIPNAEIEAIEVGRVGMSVYGRRDIFSKCSFEELPFAIPILPLNSVPTKVDGLDGWPDDQVRRKIAFRVGMMESALELCRRGKAVAYLPKFVVDFHNDQVKSKFQLSEINAPGKAKKHKQPVYLLKRKSMVENRVLKKIANELRKLS